MNNRILETKKYRGALYSLEQKGERYYVMKFLTYDIDYVGEFNTLEEAKSCFNRLPGKMVAMV